MFRILILVVSLLNFTRDYIISGDIEYVFRLVFSLFVLELIADTLLRPVLTRVFNRRFEFSHHYSFKVMLIMGCGIASMGIAVLLILLAFFSDYFEVSILCLLPFVMVVRYCVPALHLCQKQGVLYLFEIVKSVVLLLGFIYKSDLIVNIAYLIWGGGIIGYSLIKSMGVQSIPRISLTRLQANFKADYFTSIQAGVMCLVYILDKVFAFSGDGALFYLLLTKIMFTSLALTNQMFLIPINVRLANDGSGLKSMLGYVPIYSLFVFITIFAVVIFFWFVVPYSSFGSVVDSILLCVSGAVWFGVFLLREIFIRAMMMRNQFSHLGKAVLIFSLCNFAAILIIESVGLASYLWLVSLFNVGLIWSFYRQLAGVGVCRN